MKLDSFHTYVVEDLFGEIPGITSRAMFGGYGIYKDGIFFALIADGELFFKVNEETKKKYEALGSRPFTYTMRGKKMTMNYWLLPEEIMSDPEQLIEWVEQSVALAH